MTRHRPFRSIEPTFFAGLFDDPVLLLKIRPEGRSILVDCGRLHHLAKRHLKAISTLFVTHAHMDHFMGFDTLLRSLHVSPRALDLFGPPGMSERVGHKLAAYDWNLTEPWWCSIRVTEVHPDRLERSIFSGPESFSRRPGGSAPRKGRVIMKSDSLTVEGALCDHKIPSLILRFTERPLFRIDTKRLNEEGLIEGPWIDELKGLLSRRETAGTPLHILRRRNGTVVEESVGDAVALYDTIRGKRPAASIGYIGDVGMSDENLAKIENLMRGVALLVCECSHLAADEARARVSCHLCTSDVNRIAERLRPPLLLPMHLSKSYLRCPSRLYEELEVPPGVEVLRIPDYLTPRPLLASEVGRIYS